MIQIRKGIFETNSSSSHSIVITKSDEQKETVDGYWHVKDDGSIYFWYEYDLEFGRSPFDLLSDWYGRLRYAIASYSGDKEKIDEIEDICRRKIQGFTHFKFAKDRYDDSEYHGCVDHQSSGLLQAVLKKRNISLEDFIFNDRYIVVIDGDEYNVFDRFTESTMFNRENVSEILSASDSYKWSKE